MKRRFEEILEECLSAQLEGRRSVEGSLSLYPSLAAELEPILRTAEDIACAFDELDPPAYLIDRGRFRLITASSEGRRAREIARTVRGFDRTRNTWNFRHWGMLGSGVAVAIGLLLFFAVALMTSDGDDSANPAAGDPAGTSPAESAQFTASLEQFKTQLNHVKLMALQGRIDSEDLADLRDATSKLAGFGQPLDDDSRQAAEDALNEQFAFVANLADEVPLEQIPEVQDVLVTIQRAAEDLGIAIFAPLPTLLSGDLPTETPVDTPAASTTQAPTPPATETPVPTEAPVPTPSPPPQGAE